MSQRHNDDNPFATDKLKRMFRRCAEPLNLNAASSASIHIEVKETDKAFLIKAQIQGVKKEDIDVRVDGDTVAISAKFREEKEEQHNGKVLHSEIRYGSASRSFSLGTNVDAAKATARFDAGVLELTLPKKASGETRQLHIQPKFGS